jgi:hypothetical protein
LQEYSVAPLRLMLNVAAVWVTVCFGVGRGLLEGELAGDIGVTGAEVPPGGRAVVLMIAWVVVPVVVRVAGGEGGRLLLAVDGNGPVVVDGVGAVVVCDRSAASVCR